MNDIITLAVAGGLGGVVYNTLTSKTKSVWNYVRRYLFNSVEYSSLMLNHGTVGNISKFLNKYIKSTHYSTMFTKQKIDYELQEGLFHFWFEGSLFIAERSKIKKENAEDEISVYIASMNKEKFNKFIKMIEASENPQGLMITINDSRIQTTRKTFDYIFLKETIKKELTEDLDKFLNSRELYEKRGINYKRCYLFHGVAGSGKTSLIKAMADYTGRRILLIETMADLEKVISWYNHFDEYIIVFEEFDKITNFDLKGKFNKKLSKTGIKLKRMRIEINEDEEEEEDNKTELSKEERQEADKMAIAPAVTFIDGITTPSNAIFVITANDISKFPDYLMRPGRIDKIIEFDNIDSEQLEQITKSYFDSDWRVYYDKYSEYIGVKPVSFIQEQLIQDIK